MKSLFCRVLAHDVQQTGNERKMEKVIQQISANSMSSTGYRVLLMDRNTRVFDM